MCLFVAYGLLLRRLPASSHAVAIFAALLRSGLFASSRFATVVLWGGSGSWLSKGGETVIFFSGPKSKAEILDEPARASRWKSGEVQLKQVLSALSSRFLLGG